MWQKIALSAFYQECCLMISVYSWIYLLIIEAVEKQKEDIIQKRIDAIEIITNLLS